VSIKHSPTFCTHTWGVADTGTPTDISLDSQGIIGNTGDTANFFFLSPVTQTNDTLDAHVYIDTVTGSPTEARAAIYAVSATDDDRITGSALAVTGDVDVSSSQAGWATFSFTGLSLEAGIGYFLVVYNNDSDDPANNYFDVLIRSAMDGPHSTYDFLRGGYSVDGFTADTTWSTGMPGVVFESSDGTTWGNPWINYTLHVSNTSDRGMRVYVTEATSIFGVFFPLGSSAVTGVYLYEGATLRASRLFDKSVQANRHWIWEPYALQPGVAYDIVAKVSSSTNTGILYQVGGGGTVPDAVKHCRPGDGSNYWAYVTGSTPGSYTADPEQIMQMALLIGDAPEQTGGGGSGGAGVIGSAIIRRAG